jgi:hypothetical protein
MIMDYNAIFSDSQAIISTAYSTYCLDTEVADSNIGDGNPLWVVCRVVTAASQSGTFSVGLCDCATSGGTYIARFTSLAYSNGEAVAGFDLMTMPLPNKTRRYVKLYYTDNSTSGNGPTVDAYLAATAP